MDELCTTCLCAGRDLQYLENTEYYHLYLQIMNGNHDHQQTGVRVCWECCAVLRGVQRFRRQARRCQMLLSEQDNPKYHLCQPPRLSAQLVDHISYPPLAVKTEPADNTEPTEHTVADDVTVEFMYDVKVEPDDTVEHSEPEMFIDELEMDECKEQDQKKERVKNGDLSTLPEKSHILYIRAFDQFNEWRDKKGATIFSETVLLSYFTELASSRKPTSLWSIYSMLKATLKVKKNVRLEQYPKLTAFLKEFAVGHVKQQSRTFTAAEVERFVNEAPDSKYLAAKVALIVGISGGCRTNELTNLLAKDVERISDALIVVKVRDTKTNNVRNFVVREKNAKIVEKYRKLRPVRTSIDRFFVGYRKGRCVNQPIGYNKIGSWPREIASYLGLASAREYTGHCFRRTAAALASVQRQGGRKPHGT